MPKCAKCFDLFPPQFCVDIEGTEDQMCLFCNDDINSIKYDEDGIIKNYTKEDCSRDYKKFLKMVKEHNEVLLEQKKNKGG